MKETRIVLTDDLARAEGETAVEADVTVWLGYQVSGTDDSSSAQVELELTAQHRKELDELLARWLAAGHRPDNPGTMPKMARIYHPPAPGTPYGRRGREVSAATLRLFAFAERQGIDIWHKADGSEYSNGKPYLSPTLKADLAAFVDTPAGKHWLSTLTAAQGGEAE